MKTTLKMIVILLSQMMSISIAEAQLKLDFQPLFERFEPVHANHRMVRSQRDMAVNEKAMVIAKNGDELALFYSLNSIDPTLQRTLTANGIKALPLKQCENIVFKRHATVDSLCDNKPSQFLGYILDKPFQDMDRPLFKCINLITSAFRLTTRKYLCNRDGYNSIKMMGYVHMHPRTDEALNTPGLVLPPFVGFGHNTRGGQGGLIYKVTTLDDSVAAVSTATKGTLRHGLELSGPRVIIFDKKLNGGTINLRINLEINNPYVTIMGDSLPHGIRIERGGIIVRTSEVIIRHLKIRVGPFRITDGITVAGAVGEPPISNVVIDHNSVAWHIDEGISINGRNNPVSNVTVSNNIIAEGLQYSIHFHGNGIPDPITGLNSLDGHSMGTLLASVHHATFIGNLYAHNYGRNPRIATDSWVEYISNAFYDYGSIPFTLCAPPLAAEGLVSRPIQLNSVNNFFKEGPARMNRYDANLISPDHNSIPGTKVFMYGNSGAAFDAQGGNQWGSVWNLNTSSYYEVEKLKSYSPLWPVDRSWKASSLFNVLRGAGALPTVPDITDNRIRNEVLTTTGGIRNDPPQSEFLSFDRIPAGNLNRTSAR